MKWNGIADWKLRFEVSRGGCGPMASEERGIVRLIIGEIWEMEILILKKGLNEISSEWKEERMWRE